MVCPHCGKDTPLERANCVHCGNSLLITAGQAVHVETAADQAWGDWGPKLLRWFVGLLVLAIVLGVGSSMLRKRPLTASKVEKPSLPAPRPVFPSPTPPKKLPQAGLIEPAGVSLPALPDVKLAFGSRDAAVRRLFLKRRGGDAKTEAAVERGLEWLKSIQEQDGHWDAAKHGGDARRDLGVSGLALLAFLGAGHTHVADGPFKDAVDKALRYVLQAQDANGRFPGALYTQGICTMAVVEAYGMTGDTTLLQHAQLAVQAILKAQQSCGGWDYGHGTQSNRGDTSVTGWQVMALKSAARVGIEIPTGVLDKMRKFLADITRADGAIGYTNKTEPDKPWRTTHALTAAGLNAHLFAGAKHDDEAVHKAIGIILRNMPPEPRKKDDRWNPRADIYFWYHASMALCRIGGREWSAWNAHAKRLFLKLQGKDGSWDTHGDRWEKQGGKVYFTSLCILALEVYYRYE
jgi:hypothetical protein